MRTFQDTISDIITYGIPVSDIGQFDKATLILLDKAVKQGAISKGKGGEFPVIKTVYAPIGFDFVAHRSAVIQLENDLRSGKITGNQYLHNHFDYSKFISA